MIDVKEEMAKYRKYLVEHEFALEDYNAFQKSCQERRRYREERKRRIKALELEGPTYDEYCDFDDRRREENITRGVFLESEVLRYQELMSECERNLNNPFAYEGDE